MSIEKFRTKFNHNKKSIFWLDAFKKIGEVQVDSTVDSIY